MTRDDFSALVGQHVPGADGYRFESIEHGSGDAVRLRIVDARGDEIGWATGTTIHELVREAKQKTAAHELRRP